MQNAEKVLELIAEYGRMKRLDGYTPQSRGRELNGLIAKIFYYWGLEVDANIRTLDSKGEIDVAVIVNSKHFVIEAKWEASKTDTGDIAKFQKRVRQRVVGTTGLFISVAGYTPEALKDATDGDALNVIFLETDHLEAMLSGFVPPKEMLEQLLKKAANEGVSWSPLINLFRQPYLTEMTPNFSDQTVLKETLSRSSQDVEIQSIITNLPFGACGVAMKNPDELLLTVNEGIYIANIKKHSALPLLNFPNCSGSVIVDNDGGVYIRRNAGIAKLLNGKLSCIGGGLLGFSNLMKHPDMSIRVLSMTRASMMDQDNKIIITKFTDELGFQSSIYTKELPHHYCSTTSYSSSGDLLLVGGSGITLISGDDRKVLYDYKSTPLSNTNGIFRTSNDEFYICSNDTTIWRLDKSNILHEVVKIDLRGGLFTICDSYQEGGYYWGIYRNQTEEPKGCIIKWTLNS